jgi:hypothetical protein
LVCFPESGHETGKEIRRSVLETTDHEFRERRKREEKERYGTQRDTSFPAQRFEGNNVERGNLLPKSVKLEKDSTNVS